MDCCVISSCWIQQQQVDEADPTMMMWVRCCCCCTRRSCLVLVLYDLQWRTKRKRWKMVEKSWMMWMLSIYALHHEYLKNKMAFSCYLYYIDNTHKKSVTNHFTHTHTCKTYQSLVDLLNTLWFCLQERSLFHHSIHLQHVHQVLMHAFHVCTSKSYYTLDPIPSHLYRNSMLVASMKCCGSQFIHTSHHCVSPAI